MPKPYMPQNDQSVDKWNLIDEDYKEKLPKEDCDIWITRVMYTGERRVQKVSYCSTAQDIEWDGTIAWMVAQKDDTEPKPCSKLRTRVIQCFVKGKKVAYEIRRRRTMPFLRQYRQQRN